MLAIDLEWPSETPHGQVPDLVSVAWANDTDSAVLTAAQDRKSIVDVVSAALSVGYVGQNCPGDLVALIRFEPQLLGSVLEAYNAGRIHDTMTREKRIDIAEGAYRRRGGYDLGSIAGRRANIIVDKSDPRRTRYGELVGLPLSEWPPDAVRYALLDAQSTWRVYRDQQPFERYMIGNDIHARAHFVLHLMSLRGIRVDTAAVHALARDIEVETKRLRQTLIDGGLARVEGSKKNPRVVRTPNAARKAIVELGSNRRTDKGLISVSKQALSGVVVPPGHPLYAYQELTTLTGTASKNLPPLRYPSITTSYDECVVTGRMSSRQTDDQPNATNLQNLPRTIDDPRTPTQGLLNRFRGCLIPSTGCTFGIVDYSSAELVTFADVEMAWFGESRMGDAIKAGRNLHEDFAETLVQAPYDARNPDHKQARQIAKVFNFGKLGGMGDVKFQVHLAQQTGIQLPVYRVKQITTAWKHKWGTDRYFRHIDRHQAGGRFTVVAPRTGFQRGGMTYTEACNFPFQSTAAVGLKVALWDLFRATLDGGPLTGSRIVLVVHDEIVMEHPDDRAESAFAIQKQIMVDSFGLVCPDVPISVEGKLAMRYGK